MKEIKIYEPEMCCETGLCGAGVDPELLRITTIINTLEQKGIVVKRYNLSNSPREFVDDKEINEFINKYGTENLPVIKVDGKVVVVGRYPSNKDFEKWMEISPAPWNGSNTLLVGDCSCKGDCC